MSLCCFLFKTFWLSDKYGHFAFLCCPILLHETEGRVHIWRIKNVNWFMILSMTLIFNYIFKTIYFSNMIASISGSNCHLWLVPSFDNSVLVCCILLIISRNTILVLRILSWETQTIWMLCILKSNFKLIVKVMFMLRYDNSCIYSVYIFFFMSCV